MNFRNKIFSLFLFFVFFLALSPQAVFTYKHPAYNWDMLGYMALIVRMDRTTDMNEVHSITYGSIKQNLPAEEYKKLTDTPSFRRKFATDPSEFQKLLPVYAVKPLYVWMAYLFYKAGYSLPGATVMPSIISYLVIGLFLFHWLRKYLNDILAFLGGILIMYSMFVVNVARLSTPDCLSAFFLFAAIYFILEKPNTGLMFLFFVLSIFARVDNIVACCFLISFLAFNSRWKRISRTWYFLMLLTLAIVYLLTVLPVLQFGWSLFYYSEYARHIDFSKDFSQPVSFHSYIALAYSKIITAIVAYHFILFMFLSLLIISFPAGSFRKLTFDQLFLLVIMAIIFFRFLLLPDLSDRFYLGFYLIILILLIRKISPKIVMKPNENS